MSAIIVSLGAKTCGIATLSIMSLCIMTLIETINKDESINDSLNYTMTIIIKLLNINKSVYINPVFLKKNF
jgi:hypothetical protein